MDSKLTVYMAYDGDNAGRLCGRAILADDTAALNDISARINLGHEVVKRWVDEHGGIVIAGGGDEGVFSVPADAINSIDELRSDYQFATNLTATIGVGSSLSEAGKALMAGKFRGKNTVVLYDASVEAELQQSQLHLDQGTASEEEKKINEAYLQPQGTDMNESEQNPSDHADCPYCQAQGEEGIDDPSHCRYCHDADQAEPCPYCVESEAVASDDNCPYCQNPTGDDCPYCKDGAHDASVAGHPDDCPYCAESSAAPNVGDDQTVTPTAGATVQSSTTTDSENYAGQDLNNPDLPKPDAIQANPDISPPSLEGPTVNNTMLDVEGQGAHDETFEEGVENADPQSEQTVEEIGQEIDRLPHYESKNAHAVGNIDEANMPIGTAMEDGVSRPENYNDPNTPSDMGLAEDDQSPNVTSLMQEGLDSHADNIQREKIVNLVSEALVGFKACKGILEKAKAQAPQLYDSSIAMLRAMIEMAKMLGLDQEANAPDGQNPLDGAPASDDDAMAQEAAIDPSLNDPKNSNPANGGLPAGNTSSNIPVYEPKEDGEPEKKLKGQ